MGAAASMMILPRPMGLGYGAHDFSPALQRQSRL
jgi:hypothetical protein